jgi:hypothetical protein
MLDFTDLAAVQFSENGTFFLRVYYQDGCLVKESCYDSQNGWYTMPDDIVANDARVNTPIGSNELAGGEASEFLLEIHSNPARVLTQVRPECTT